MNLSVIIPCFNAADTIANQLEALSREKYSEAWEVIVSDNGSTDQTCSIVRYYERRLTNLRFVNSSDRRGAAHARNMGALAASYDALAFCDADDEVAPGWVAAMGKALSNHDFVASRFDAAKLNSLALQRALGNPQRDGIQRLWYPPYLPHAGTSGLGVKRSIHEAVGGFDETLPVLEDTDYCLRIQLAGWKLTFVPDALVYIRHRNTLRGIYHQSRLWAQYNVFLYKRYRPSGAAISGSWKLYAHDWKQLFRSFPHIRDEGCRAAWVWLLGRQIGRLQGSLKYRISSV
jgi:GT2 family glycosyltransferase